MVVFYGTAAIISFTIHYWKNRKEELFSLKGQPCENPLPIVYGFSPRIHNTVSVRARETKYLQGMARHRPIVEEIIDCSCGLRLMDRKGWKEFYRLRRIIHKNARHYDLIEVSTHDQPNRFIDTKNNKIVTKS